MYLEKIYPSAILYTTNLTWPQLGLTPGHKGGYAVTNHLGYGIAPVRVGDEHGDEEKIAS
jgi:hypothetical protein